MSAVQQIDNDAETAAGRSVYVYEGPVRLWHWINALCILTLAVTGYLIASPLPTVAGEASANFLMGYIRFAHFSAAYVFAVAFLVRIYWAIAGNHHARQLFVLPVTDREWWRGLLHELRYYFFLARLPKKYLGHNPLAHFFMFLFVTVASVLMIFTGFALYGEGKGLGSWQDALFGWVIPFLGGSQATHSWHHLGMWGIVCFVIIHVYAAIREDILSRQSMISTMVSGYRMFRD
ncbi:MAG: Ni/Fe-hydrogenase, b-type cytochrome subunit [Betaproteobacteria bacterium]|nr:Ni/Fe-hydrogenase, b-type cytochrome subunit [Betaproteobacteria bacterium]